MVAADVSIHNELAYVNQAGNPPTFKRNPDTFLNHGLKQTPNNVITVRSLSNFDNWHTKLAELDENVIFN